MKKIVFNKNEKAVFWICSFGLSRKKIGQIFSLFPSFSDAFEKFLSRENEIVGIVGETQFQIMKAAQTEKYVYDKIFEIEKLKMQVITCASTNFPEKLKAIPNAPVLLFSLGNQDLLSEKAVSVVGTRKPTRYGREMAEIFSKRLAEAGLVLVSGLAFGIDTVVHESVLAVNGKTIAVLGGGLDEIYPALNTELARRIVKSGGLLISEYWPKIRPTVYSFPERNELSADFLKVFF